MTRLDPVIAEFSPLSRFVEAAFSSIGQMESDGDLLSFGRIRGNGPSIHFSELIQELDSKYPVDLKFPFENSDRVGGDIWGQPPEPFKQPAIAKLQWLAHADDLPLHTHEHSDRFIIVIGGRGFFHWSDQSLNEFDGSSVHTIAARDRDVFVFRRGLLHTFSTHDEPMTLLSVQSPFIPFIDPRQYTLPNMRWIAKHNLEGHGVVQVLLAPLISGCGL